MAQPPEDDSFFSRWSKRKRVSTAEQAGPAPEPAPPDAAPDAVESLSDEELAELPSLDMFTIETDIRPFLQKGVPHAMRNAALRKKWLLTPSIRDHADPAVDYAWDWNTPGGVPGDGAAPTVQKTAEMLREFTRPRCDAAQEDIAKEDGISKTQPPLQRTDDAPAAAVQHDPSGLDDLKNTLPDLDAQQSGGADNLKENQSDIADAPQRRRHGSALPD